MKVRCWVISLLIAAPLHTMAGIDNITPGEIARIPEYCPDSQTFSTAGFPENPSPAQRRWVSVMGKTFWAIHHYCWAQIAANRAERIGTTRQARDSLLESAIADIQYVLRHSTPDFVLLPELYTRIGDYYVRMSRPVDAIQAYEMSISKKVDYWPPYVRMAEVLARIDRQAQAVELLEGGLRKMPDQPQLAQALQSLKLSSSSSQKSRAAGNPRGTSERN